MPMTEQQWTVVAHHLREIVARAAPGWTIDNSHDPGITVLEVLNYALADLQVRRPRDDGPAVARPDAVRAHHAGTRHHPRP